MATPQDDLFTGPPLDSKWTYSERTGSPDLGYSLTDNPGNFTAKVKVESESDEVSHITRLLQDTIHNNYLVEVGITQSNIAEIGHETGILIVENNTTFIYFVKSYRAVGSRLRVYKAVGGAPTLVEEIVFTDDTNIVLQVRKYNDEFTFYYKKSEDQFFTQTPTPVDATGFGYGAGTNRYIGLGSSAGNAGAATFNCLFDYLYFRRLADIALHGGIYLRVTNDQTVDGDMIVQVVNYPPVTGLEVKQHFEAPINTIEWVNPSSEPGYVSTTIVRKDGSYPKDINDGTQILTTAVLETFDDGPHYDRARKCYAAFATYAAKVTFPDRDATLPVFILLYKNVGRRFSRLFKKTMWTTLYSWSRVIQELVDVDIPEALAQFNINTATSSFLDLWGKLFGARRFANETDPSYSGRILSRVISPRTIPATIIAETLKVPGVVFCEIADASFGQMFVGHSFIGFSGALGYETLADNINATFSDNPFFFTVRVKIKQGTDLDQILKTINDNKAAGTRYVVEILEILP